MAKPIKNTPILYGRESDKFIKKVKENDSKKISKGVHDDSLKTFSKIMKNAKI